MKRLIIFSHLVVAIIGASIAFADGMPMDRPSDRPFDVPPLHVLQATLRLSEEQLNTVRALLQARAESVGPISREIGMLQGQLEQILGSDAQDPATVGEIVTDIRALEAEREQIFQQYRAEFQAILGPEQRERLAQVFRIAMAIRTNQALVELGLAGKPD